MICWYCNHQMIYIGNYVYKCRNCGKYIYE